MKAVSLTGAQYAQLLEAVLNAFDYDSLAMCVRFQMNKHLDRIVTVQANFTTQVAQLLDWAEKQSQLRQLVAGLRVCNSGNEDLEAAERDIFGTPGMALTAAEAGAAVKRTVESQAQADPKLQALLRSRPGLPIDVGGQEQRWQRLKVAVARVEAPAGTAVASAFLVGPDLILTNDHVRKDARFDDAPADVRIRFGYAREEGVADPGVTYTLAANWKVAASPDLALDFCLARLARPAGTEPCGHYLGAPPRGCLVPAADAVREGQIVTVLGHPRGEPLMQSSGAVTEIESRGWMEYSANTLPGSSGSPVLNERWELVGLHSREGTTVANRGVTLAAILADLPPEVRSLVGQAP